MSWFVPILQYICNYLQLDVPYEMYDHHPGEVLLHFQHKLQLLDAHYNVMFWNPFCSKDGGCNCANPGPKCSGFNNISLKKVWVFFSATQKNNRFTAFCFQVFDCFSAWEIKFHEAHSYRLNAFFAKTNWYSLFGSLNKLNLCIQANFQVTQIRFTKIFIPQNITLMSKYDILHLPQGIYCFISLPCAVNC